MVGGVYVIICNGNGKIYIGGSKNIKNRITAHVSLLNKMKHTNINLQNAWNLYGKENFIFDVVEHCNTEEIKRKEAFWINESKSYDIRNGFNTGVPTSLKLDKTNYSNMNIWRLGETEITTIKDFAEYLGVSRQAIYTWIECQGMPVVKNKEGDGKQYLILLNEAFEWVGENKYK